MCIILYAVFSVCSVCNVEYLQVFWMQHSVPGASLTLHLADAVTVMKPAPEDAVSTTPHISQKYPHLAQSDIISVNSLAKHFSYF